MRTDWRRALQSMPRPVSSRPADEFWQDFHASRAFHPQHPAAAAARRLVSFLVPALAAACRAILLAGGLLLARGGWRMQGPSTVQSYSIDGRYTSVMLLTDESTQATILWISGMEASDSGVAPGDGTLDPDDGDEEDT